MPVPEATAITGSITSSLVLAADDPAALAQFYGALLKVEPQPGLSSTHWRVPWPAGAHQRASAEVPAHHRAPAFTPIEGTWLGLHWTSP